MPPRYTTTTEGFGNPLSSPFSDETLAGDLETAKIARITVRYVDTTVLPVTPEGGDVTFAEINLVKGEWITQIEGCRSPAVIRSLKFVSNKQRTWGPFGVAYGEMFVLDAGSDLPANLVGRMGLLYFSGYADDEFINRLKATFADYSAPSLSRPQHRLLNIEHFTVANPSTACSSSLSTFTQMLISRTITLIIGPDRTEFRVPEVVLCRLPFFRAALQGGFKEASEKVISMPEDVPAAISALIEFLYTGRYTYAADNPAGDFKQGAFHAAVYAAASKYGYQEMLSDVLRFFGNVLRQQRGLGVIALLKVASANGLNLALLEPDQDSRAFMAALPKLVVDLYSSHREEMDAMVLENPVLASDLLLHVASVRGV